MGLAIALLSIAFFIELPQLWEGAFGVVGVALLLTGLARYCPVNQFLGIRSRKPH